MPDCANASRRRVNLLGLLAIAFALSVVAAFAGLALTSTALATPVGERCPWTSDPADIPKVTTYTCNRELTPSTLPSVGTTWDLGYGNVTDAYFAGTSSYDDPNHQVWFCFTLNSTYLGGSINFQWAAQCMAPRAQTPGCVTSGTEGWPATWTGRYTSVRASFTISAVNVGADGTVAITGTINMRSEDTNGTQHGSVQNLRTTSPITLIFPYRGPATLSLTKESAKPAVTDGNPLYTMTGIQYGLYASQQDAADDANRLFTWTFDANGNTSDVYETTVGAPITYYVKEVSLGESTGYKLSSEITSVTVQIGANTFTAKDAPIMDPFIVQKAVSSTAAGNTDYDLTDRVRWTVEFYAGAYYDTVEAAQASGSPTYSWVIKAEANGRSVLDSNHLVSGDPIIYDSTGDSSLPLGTVVCYESWVDPNGPVKLTDTTPRLIWETTSGSQFKAGSSTWTDDAKTGYIEVSKSLVNSAGETVSTAPLAGIKVKVVSAGTGATVATLTLDANGYAKSGLLTWGTYKLIEIVDDDFPTNVEPWYVTNSVSADTPFATVDVHEDGVTVSASFEDVLKTGTAKLLKQSSDAQLAATSSVYSDMTGATYGLYATEADAQADTNRIFTFVCNADGTTNETEQIECGTHLWVRELTAPTSGAYKLSDQIVEVVITDYVNTFEVTEEPYTGSFSVTKLDSSTGATPQGEATFEGMVVTVEYYPIYAATIESCTGTPEATFDLTTDASGTAASGTRPLGSYVVYETTAPNGYKVSDVKHLVVISPAGTSYITDPGDTVRIQDDAITATISVAKTLKNAGGSSASASKLEGIQIAVKDATGSTVDTITLDATGCGTSAALAIGTYTLTEIASSVPAGVQPYSWSATGSSDEIAFATVEITTADDGEVFETSLTDYTTTYVPVQKTDVDTGEGLPGATITLYKCPDAYITIADGVVTVSDSFDRTNLSAWQKVADYTTDSEGYAGMSMAKFGLYAWVETKAPVLDGGIVYLDEARTQDIDATEPIIHEMLIDKDHMSSAQSCADKRVDIAVKITERTIAITSAALDATGNEYPDNNVENEGQWYFISAANASSVDTENFQIDFDFANIISNGGRVVTVCTPTTTGDKDGKGVLYYTTDGSNWIEWSEISATSAQRFDVESLGVEITGIKIDYGKVTKDMTVGTQYSPANSDDLAFEIVYTRALAPEDNVTILHDCHVYTDLAVSSETTIWADDVDDVQTVVIMPKTRRSSFDANGGFGNVATGDLSEGLLFGIIGLGFLAILYLVMKRRKKAAARIALGVITVGLSLALLPALALAEPAVVEKTYTFMDGEEQPVIPETFTEKGDTFNLVSVTAPVADPSFTPASQSVKKTAGGNFATLDEARAAYPETIYVDEDGFKGEIAQTEFKTREIYGTYTKVEDVTRQFGPYPTNDVTWIADLVDLEYTSVSWSVVETNSVGIPTSYMATAVTKEATSTSVQTGYAVAVTYEGTITKDEQRFIIRATYEGPDGDAVIEPEPEPEPEPANAGMSAGAIAGIAGGGVAFLGLLGFLFFRRKNVIVRDLADTTDLGRAMLKSKDGKQTVTIPASIPVEGGVLLKLKDEHATGEPLSVVHEGRGEVLQTRSARRVYVQPAPTQKKVTAGTPAD